MSTDQLSALILLFAVAAGVGALLGAAAGGLGATWVLSW